MRLLVRVVLGAFLAFAGIGHFVATDEFTAQVPDFLPFETAIIYVSGVVEIALGGWLISGWRRVTAGWVAAAFFLAVFPGNISQLVTATDAFGLDSDLERGVRLLFQPVLIAAALWSTGAWRAWREHRTQSDTAPGT